MGDRLSNLHESLDREETLGAPSNRSFGLTMAAILMVLFLGLFFVSGNYNWWVLLASGIATIAAFFCPASLSKINVAWFRFGLILHSVANPLVLGLIFLFITPIGLAWRQVNKDPLRLKFDPKAKSYWITREPAGPNIEDFPRQF
jgi:hypothetical protein